MSDYVSGIITEIIGIIITVVFVQLLFSRKNKNDKKELEKKRLSD